ncbi:MAG: prepilin-type N-terminal cleavage/methylation domain-containing protein [Epsilonproteobacteria bacterium]|jgi:general secretion pathway protein G|nr:prepilin-type N-terminal cleavage/methylation domain-containing protein [Campylobacterota bacterium]
MSFKKGFTLIEIIFVLVVIGILASLALPKFGETLNQADLVSARAKVAAIRNGLEIYKSKHLLLGEDPYPPLLEDDSQHLFSNVLSTPTTPSNKRGGWERDSSNPKRYRYYLGTDSYLVFEYDDQAGTFKCIDSTLNNTDEICNTF